MREVVWEGNTETGYFQVVDTIYNGRPARVLYSGKNEAAQSGIAKDGKPDLLFDYNQRFFELVTNYKPKRLLLIGGGSCTLPAALLATLPDIEVDVVEPDSGLIELAYKFFDLPVDGRLRIFHTDGRTFLNEHADSYDVILVDVFVHTSIPEDLKTLQAFEAIAKHIRPKGIMAMNIISPYHGGGSHVLRSIYAGCCQSFDEVDIFLAGLGYSLWLPQNFVLTAQKGLHLPLKDYIRYEAVQPPEVNPNEALQD